jgi:hypothetical protein
MVIKNDAKFERHHLHVPRAVANATSNKPNRNIMERLFLYRIPIMFTVTHVEEKVLFTP